MSQSFQTFKIVWIILFWHAKSHPRLIRNWIIHAYCFLSSDDWSSQIHKNYSNRYIRIQKSCEKSNGFSLPNKCLDCLRRPAFRRTQLTLHYTQLCSFCLERLRYTTEACSTDKKHYKTYRNFLSPMWARYAFCIRTNSFLCNMHVNIQAVLIVNMICQKIVG